MEMTADEILVQLKPLLVSRKLDDLLEAKEALFQAKKNLPPSERERIGDELSRLQRAIEDAMEVNFLDLKEIHDDDEIPTLDATRGEWKNIEK